MASFLSFHINDVLLGKFNGDGLIINLYDKPMESPLHHWDGCKP